MSEQTETEQRSPLEGLEAGAASAEATVEVGATHGALEAGTLRDRSSGGRPPDSQAAPAQEIGRYRILSRLGAGAMGVVFAAYDPELDRKVALKLIRSTRGRQSRSANARLLREAQALAKLDHPNVVPVHDAGTFEGQVFIAMKFVEGQTLTQWLDNDPPPSLDEILDVFVRAGRGLAAAHAQGLIHRDFKPDNLMIASDGKVRVMDFGLVRSDEDTAGESGEFHESDETSAGDLQLVDPRLTRTGALLGTPAYMAPELFVGGDASAQSDQFSFCVSLYQALYGERPFAGQTVANLVFNASEGKVAAPPSSSKVPSWLRTVLLRGLHADPASRWPSIDAVVEAISDDPAARRRRRVLIGASTLVVGGLLAIGPLGLLPSEGKCEGMQAHLAGVWDDPVQAQIATRVEASTLPYAAKSWRRAQTRIDSWAQDWVLARRDACEDTHLRGEQSASLLDLRMACLDEQLGTLRATAKVLSEADDGTLRRLSKLAGALPELTSCADAAYLSAEVRPPTDPVEVERVAKIDALDADAAALARAGKLKEALAAAQAAWTLAQQSEHGPARVRAQAVLANEQSATGDYEGSVASAQAAYFDAVRLRLHTRAGSTARTLVYTLGYHLARYDEALVWGQHAQANFGDRPDPRLESNLGAVLLKKGDYPPAREHLERALAIYDEQEGPDNHLSATVHMNLTALSSYEGKGEEALTHIDATLRGYANYYGPEHPEVGLAQLNRGASLAGLARWDEALETTQKAREILEAAHGPNHADVALAVMNLGLIAYTDHRYEEALDYTKRALAIKQEVQGKDAGEVGDLWLNLSAIHSGMGNLVEAREAAQESLRVAEAAHGPEHQRVGSAVNNLASVLSEEGDLEGALALNLRALDIRSKALGNEHPFTAESMRNCVNAYMRLDRDDEARAMSQRAIAATKAAQGEAHPGYASALAQGARLDVRDKKFTRAREGFAQAIRIHEASQGADDAKLAYLLRVAAQGELDANAPKLALPLAERALAIGEKHKENAKELAPARFVLAQALWLSDATKANKARALELASLAKAGWGEAGTGTKREFDEVVAWLHEHER